MQIDYDDSQLLRGILEGCVLLVIKREETYGYEIIQKLKLYGFKNISEGTIYPLLLRFEKKCLITVNYKTSPLGPKRKYFTITEIGNAYLQQFIANWSVMLKRVNFLIEEETNEYVGIKEEE